MTSEVVSPPQPRRSSSHKRPPAVKKALSSLDSSNSFSSMLASPNTMSSVSGDGERTVKKLRMSKALTIPDGTMVADACRRMATRRVDAALLIASNAMLSGIVTDKDIAIRVIAEELKPDETPLSKIMTKNPVFVTANTLATDALQKMVQGKFRHLPVVEGGEVIALLDITKCLYDAISKMEKAAEQGSAIVAAVEGVERQLGNNFAQNMFAETFRERMFKPSLSTIITENKVATVSPSDSVLTAAKKMRDARVNSVVIMNNDKVQGILTSRDILTRVLAQNLPPEQTLMEKVMTPNPACTIVETTILEALHIMRGGKFLHLPVLDKEGMFVACVEVLQLIHAAMSMVESSSGAMNEMTGTMMHKFWDSALSLEQPDESDGQSEAAMMTSEGGIELGKHSSFGLSNPFSFKFEDPNGRVYRFNSGSENLDELVSCVVQRLGPSNGNNRPQLQYEDDEGDKVVLICDADLTGAVLHARSAGEKVLRLYVDYPKPDHKTSYEATTAMTPVGRSGSSYFHPVILAGATVLTAIGVTVYLRHSNTGGAWKRW